MGSDIIEWEGKNIIINNAVMTMERQARFLWHHMNGRTSDEQIREKFKREFGITISNKNFNTFVLKLQKNNLLSGRHNGCLVSKKCLFYLKKRYSVNKIREPAYAGSCYKSNPEELLKEIEACFSLLDTRKFSSLCRGIKTITGAIVPHSNIELSGPCSAWVYKAISSMPLPDLVIIFGPDHSACIRNPFSVTLKDFRTPMGIVKVDKDFGKMLKDICDFNIMDDNFIHATEHSIEIQLPFLQYIYKQNMAKVKILPILCREESSSTKDFIAHRNHFMRSLKGLIIKSKKRTIIISTGDLMHITGWKTYPEFHKRNKSLINSLLTGDVGHFEHGLSQGERHLSCGRAPFYALLRLLGPCKGRLLNYSWASNSKLVYMTDKKYFTLNNIGYAGMVFDKKTHD